MNLTKRQIREDIVERLKMMTEAGFRIYDNRVSPNVLKNLPCIAIFTNQKTGDGIGTIKPVFNTELTVTIEILVADNTEYSEKIDDLLDDVKQILFGDKSWYDQFEDISRYDESVLINNEGEKVIVTGSLEIGIIQSVEQYCDH